MNLDISMELERLSVKLRKVFGLLIDKEKFVDFKQITFVELSACVTEAFPKIKIFDEMIDDTYVIKCNGENPENDYYEIYIDKTQKHIELLMHEVAHVLFHNLEIPYNTPVGKNSGTWEQELEANYFSRAFLVPEEYFIKALSVFSRNDGTVDLEEFSKRFNVPTKVIVERGRDLRIW